MIVVGGLCYKSEGVVWALLERRKKKKKLKNYHELLEKEE